MDCKKYFGFFDEEHPEPYVIKSGTLPIIISAPHTYRHFREGRVKEAERGAGVIAMALGDMKGTHRIVKAREDGDDPNYSADSPYKKALAAYMTENGVRYLIDLHELAPSRPTDVNPLINGGKNIKGNEDLYGEIKNVFINGGFIPGFRPGKPTSDFIAKVLSKVTLFGAIYLGIVAICPLIAGKILSHFGGLQNMAIGGTSVIIVVGVALETVKALENQMLMRQYKGFLE